MQNISLNMAVASVAKYVNTELIYVYVAVTNLGVQWNIAEND